MSIKLEGYDIYFNVDSYKYGDGLALQLLYKDEDAILPYAMLTVNLEEFSTYGNKAFVDINNLGDEILQWIEDNNIGIQTSRLGFSGFCIYPEVEFNMEEINKHLIGGKENEQI